MKILIICLVSLSSLCSCTYMKHAAIQAEYSRIQQAEPAQVNLKHMIDRSSYFVIGRTLDQDVLYINTSLSVAAYSSKFKPNERVDLMYLAGSGTHFGLNLPAGEYQLLVYADKDNDQVFERTEVVGRKTLNIIPADLPEKVLSQVKIELSAASEVMWAEPILKPELAEPQTSLFYPTGTIRSFEDPLFSKNMATLGMYDPASFQEKVPTMFFALEEDLEFKIPVIFVHGIGDSIRAFKPIVDRLDRQRYKPWFFYYPSGGDLDQLAELFHRIFLSGNVADLRQMPIIIVAHSMGGLVVREALNRYENNDKENRVALLVTIASPFGGHPAAASGEKHGLMVLPSWRDLSPESPFIEQLFREPLPEPVDHELYYAYDNPATLKLSKNSDGVVPLSSQLRLEAQQQATRQLGFESSHTGILDNEDMIANLLARLAQVKNFYPEDHLELLFQGGYDVELSDAYSPIGQYIIHNVGKYWMAVTEGTLKPFFPEQEWFLRVLKGEESPQYPSVEDWLRFLKEHPEFISDP